MKEEEENTVKPCHWNENIAVAKTSGIAFCVKKL